MKTRQVPISDFKAHCSEELRAIEESDLIVEITRHGKVIAIAHAPLPPPAADCLLGAGVATARFGPKYDPHKPAFADNDWSMNE